MYYFFMSCYNKIKQFKEKNFWRKNFRKIFHKNSIFWTKFFEKSLLIQSSGSGNFRLTGTGTGTGISGWKITGIPEPEPEFPVDSY